MPVPALHHAIAWAAALALYIAIGALAASGA